VSGRPDGWKRTSGQRAGVPYWEAKYPGECVVCPDPIEVGQEIMRADAGGYVHVICPHPPAVSERPGKFDGTSSDEMGY
jgi:hypothetical protein